MCADEMWVQFPHTSPKFFQFFLKKPIDKLPDVWYNKYVIKREPKARKEVTTMEKHCAYNLTTGEILACSTGSHLKRCVAIIAKNDRECGVRGEWIFGHKGINAIMAKANKIGKERVGR